MDQSPAVWILIILALVMASLPFVAERPFLVLPWFQAGETRRPLWLRWFESIVFFAVLVGLRYLALSVIGKSIFIGSDLGQVVYFLAKVAGTCALIALALAYPGWRNKGRVVSKSFFDRLLELLVFYALVGTLGFAFESSIGSAFVQGWEFYAVTLSLFIVLAYPGFVYRYLFKRRKSNKLPGL